MVDLKKLITLEIGKVEGQILGDFPLAKISKELSFRPPGFQFTKPFQKGHWDGRIRMLKKNAMFPAGLAPRLQKCLTSLGYALTIRYTYPLPPTYQKENIQIIMKDGTKARGYQANAVIAAINKRRGIIKLPTAAGKTIIAGLIVRNLMKPTIFLTHRKEILHQTYDRFLGEFGRNNVSRLGDGLKGRPRMITVGMIPTLEKMKPKERFELLNEFEILIADEVHHAKSKSWGKVLNSCQATWRIGLSATPADGQAIMPLEAVTGPIIFERKAKDLAEQGFLTVPEIVISRVMEPAISDRYDYQQAARMGIVENDRRNRRIILMAKVLIENKKGPVIVFSTVLDHIQEMENWAIKKKLKYIVLTGKDSSKIRKNAIEKMKTGEIQLLFVSTIFDEGVDIPNIGSAIMAFVGRSKTKLIQRIGRGMRVSKGKDKLIVIDFWDDTCKVLLNQSKARKSIYKKEGYKMFIGSLKKYLAENS
ncbi:MAG: DEAD/DEAH box helicase [Actinomycetia bacterium]|nr:DEAD/DEAH box helicase [Actinomycetes bacterium]